MPVVVGVNPSMIRKPKPSKGGKPRKEKSMAGKKKGKKKGSGGSKPKTKTRTVTVTKWRTRNPAKKKKGGGGRARAKRGIAALDIGKAIRGSVALVAGMVAAKAAVNKITAGGSETERWSWPNIATAALTGFLAAFLLGAVFNLPRSTTSLIFMGGLALSLYKAFTTKLAPKWTWAESWFGADEDINPALLGAGGEIDIFAPIQGYGEDYEVYDGYGYDEDAENMLGEMGFDGGNTLSPYDPTMGGEVVPFQPELGYYGQDSPYPAVVNERARQLSVAAKSYPGSY
jgi:hypothetical protein